MNYFGIIYDSISNFIFQITNFFQYISEQTVIMKLNNQQRNNNSNFISFVVSFIDSI